MAAAYGFEGRGRRGAGTRSWGGLAWGEAPELRLTTRLARSMFFHFHSGAPSAVTHPEIHVIVQHLHPVPQRRTHRNEARHWEYHADHLSLQQAVARCLDLAL